MDTRTCAKCRGPVTKHAKTGLCARCSVEARRQAMTKPPRTCAACGQPMHRQTKGDTCQKCYQSQRSASATPQTTFAIKGDTGELHTLASENPRTLKDLIRVCEIDTNEWTVDRWVANKWEMGYKLKNDVDARSMPLYQIKVWLIRKAGMALGRADIEAMKQEAAIDIPAHPVTRTGKPGPYMLELSIPDLHIGKLAWSKETGYANYDIKIAVRLFQQAVDTLLERTKGFTFERILLPIGNDLLHSDTKQGKTFAGTPLDTDSRYFKSFTSARRCMVYAIEKLRRVAPVDVVIVPGNHDTMSAWHLGDSLECYYRKDPDVRVENSPRHRKYVSFGKVAIMLTHGDKSRATDWPLIFATEAPKIFSKARHREIHTGHLHKTRLEEKNGVRVRVSPALCSADAWHSEMGFVGSLRGAEAFVWSKNEGLVATTYFNVEEQ